MSLDATDLDSALLRSRAKELMNLAAKIDDPELQARLHRRASLLEEVAAALDAEV